MDFLLLCPRDTVALNLQDRPFHVFQQIIDGIDVGILVGIITMPLPRGVSKELSLGF